MHLLHISDLHIGNLISPINETERANDLVDAIIKKWSNSETDEKPVIVITGDIVDSGFKWQYERAKTILDRIKDNKFDIACVPGNHDYGPKGNFVGERFSRYYRQYIEDVDYPNPAIGKDIFTVICINSMENEHGLSDRSWTN